MITLSEQVQDLLKDRNTVKVLTTTEEDGTPHTVFKGSLTALDEKTIAYAEAFEQSDTYQNMLRNYWRRRLVSVFLFNPSSGSAFQIKGRAWKFLYEGPVWDEFLKRTWEMMPDANPAGVWLIRPEKVTEETYDSRRNALKEKFPDYEKWWSYIGKRP